MFNQQIEEIAKSSTKSPKTPKQYKFEVPIQSKTQQTPVNAGSNYVDEDFVPIVEDPARPVAKVIPQPPFEAKQESVEEVEKEHIHEAHVHEEKSEVKTEETLGELRAM